MPPVVAAAGIAAISGLGAAAISSHSAGNAADIQKQSSDAALAAAKEVKATQDQRYNDAQARAQQFRNAPLTYTPMANAYGSKGMAGQVPAPQTAPPPMSYPQAQPQAAAYGPQGLQKAPVMPMQASQQPMQGQQEPMVQMVYPQTGERSQVKQSQVKHYQDLGAQVVG